MKTIFFINIALLICLRSFAQSPDSARTYFKKGMEEAAAKRYLVASRHFDKALAFDPKFAEAYIENGRVSLEMRKPDAALANFTKANELQPSNTGIIKELAILFFNNRQFAKAVEMAQKCNCPEADRIISMSYFHQEDYGRAVPGLQKAFQKNPADAEVAYTLGSTYLQLEDEKNAVTWYRKAVDIDTGRNVWIYELALIYYNLNQYADAVKYFNKASAAGYTKSNDFYENAGFAYLYSGDFENGMKNLSIVLDRKPNNTTLLADIAQALYQSKRYDDALVYYQKLMALNPKDAKALYMAGLAFQKKGEKEKGQAMCEQAIAMDPSLAEKRQKRGEQFGL